MPDNQQSQKQQGPSEEEMHAMLAMINQDFRGSIAEKLAGYLGVARKSPPEKKN